MSQKSSAATRQEKASAYLSGRFSAHQQGAAALQVSGLTFAYDGQTVLENLSFELKAGERVAVVGPNGAGKSTLFKIIAGMLKPTRGQVKVYGHEPGGHICIAYVPQRSQVDWGFPVNVADVVMMGRIGRLGLLRWPGRRDWRAVEEALEMVGMADYSRRQISELSGGQQQRVFLARALAQQAELMLMDEPFNGLDLTTQEEIFRILGELRRTQVTVMVAMHDLKLAAERFDRVMLLNRRLLGLGDPKQVFAPKNLISAYGSHLSLVPLEEGMMLLEDTCCEEGRHSHD